MYGPSTSSIVGGMLVLLLVGCALGIGCEHGCAYTRRHIHLEWLPN